MRIVIAIKYIQPPSKLRIGLEEEGTKPVGRERATASAACDRLSDTGHITVSKFGTKCASEGRCRSSRAVRALKAIDQADIRLRRNCLLRQFESIKERLSSASRIGCEDINLVNVITA